MLPIALLMIEHRQIERMVPLLHAEAINAREGKVDPLRIDSLVDFVRTYADKCHHGKEEDILFASLQTKPLPPELIMIMRGLIEDHRVSRSHVGTVVDANARYRSGDLRALQDMAMALEALATLYPKHIETEDRRFFIQCMSLFELDERKRMLAEFQTFDRELVHQVYKARLDALIGGREKKAEVKPSGGELAKAGERWICTVCDHVYDSAKGDLESGIPPGTRFEALPDDWVCPVCGAQKKDFKKL